MKKIEINKENLMKLLKNKDITIGQGTYGLVKKIDDNTLLKIYYKKIYNTYKSLNEQTLDKEISNNKEIADFIDNLPGNIRKMLPEDEHKLLDCIEPLPNSSGSISKGRILKITIDNFLDCDDKSGKESR